MIDRDDEPPANGDGDGICPECRGTGELDGITCSRCDGSGRLVEGVGQ